MGGAVRLLPAAAGPARRARSAGDALDHARPGRPADVPGSRRAVSTLHRGDPPVHPRRGRRGLRAGGHPGLAAELERAWAIDYESARERLAARGGDLPGAFAPHAQLDVLVRPTPCCRCSRPTRARACRCRPGSPLTSTASAARVDAGGPTLARWRRAGWTEGGSGDLARRVLAARVRARAPSGADPRRRRRAVTCVELTRRYWLGRARAPAPAAVRLRRRALPDRSRHDLARVERGRLPRRRRLPRLSPPHVHHHQPWRNDGGAYDHELALARAREHAADFVFRTRERLRRDGDGLPGGGLAVCALDTELLGHWWYEGLHWLQAVSRSAPDRSLSSCAWMTRPSALSRRR